MELLIIILLIGIIILGFILGDLHISELKKDRDWWKQQTLKK